MISISENIEMIKEIMQDNMERKQKLATEIQQATEQLTEELKEIKEELSRVSAKLNEVNRQKDDVEDKALFLIDDRGQVGKAKKYETSINEYL